MTRLSVHESGHACIALSLGLDVQYATVERDTDSLAHVWFRRFADMDVEKLIVALLAGEAAEARYAKLAGIVLLQDYSSADQEMIQTLSAVACDCRLDHWPAHRFRAAAEWRRRAADAVAHEWGWITAVADALAWHGHMTPEEILDLRGAPPQGARVAESPHDSSEPSRSSVTNATGAKTQGERAGGGMCLS